MHGDEDGRGRERRSERRVAGDGAAGDRAEHDAEDHVEGGGAAHEALLAEAHDADCDHVDDGRPQRHLQDIDIPAFEPKPENHPQQPLDLVHNAPPSAATFGPVKANAEARLRFSGLRR